MKGTPFSDTRPKELIFTLVIVLALLVCGSSAIADEAGKYAGTYWIGVKNAEIGSYKSLRVYPETADNVLFYFEANRGPPSYNSGGLVGRIKPANGEADFVADEWNSSTGSKNTCELKFRFSKDAVEIVQDRSQSRCDFGHGVFADGVYRKTSSKIPLLFRNRSGDEFRFEIFLKKSIFQVMQQLG